MQLGFLFHAAAILLHAVRLEHLACLRLAFSGTGLCKQYRGPKTFIIENLIGRINSFRSLKKIMLVLL
jgi:hypothetical protein